MPPRHISHDSCPSNCYISIALPRRFDSKQEEGLLPFVKAFESIAGGLCCGFVAVIFPVVQVSTL